MTNETLTIQDIMDILKDKNNNIDKVSSYVGVDWTKVYDEAINALKKQVPMKPIHITGDDCPICKYSVNTPYIIGRMKMKYCRNCGQAIDWS